MADKPQKPPYRPVPPENIYPARPGRRYIFWLLLGITFLFFVIGMQLLPQVAAHRLLFVFSIPAGTPMELQKACFSLSLLVAVVTAWITFSTHQLRVEVTGREIHLYGDLFFKKISADDVKIDEARIVDLTQEKEYGLRWKLAGVSLPDYRTGLFTLRRGGLALALITDATAVLWLPTCGKLTLLVSLQQNEELLARLQKYASRTVGTGEGS